MRISRSPTISKSDTPHTNNTITYIFTFSAPLRIFGHGTFQLTAVKEIDGTPAFLQQAESDGVCQGSESQESCLARSYSTRGIEQCHCVPYQLRNYSNHVGISGRWI